jgi:hypothetical protein
MARFMIEVPHEADALACARAVDALLRVGSHFIPHADWGCKDGVHKAWIIVDVEDKAEARGIVPLPFRANARVTALNVFTLNEVDELLSDHQGKAGAPALGD